MWHLWADSFIELSRHICLVESVYFSLLVIVCCRVIVGILLVGRGGVYLKLI